MKVFFICFSLLLGTACTRLHSSCMALPEKGSYCLQSTKGMAAFELQQQIDFSLKGHEETLISQLEVDEQGMCMVGLTPLGQKLIQLRFGDEGVKADFLPTARLEPALLLGTIQLSTWAPQRIRQGLDASSQLEDTAAQRRITRKGALVMKVDYTRGLPPDGDMVIEFPAWGMSMRVSTLERVDVSDKTATP